jgi:hypothetical protein
MAEVVSLYDLYRHEKKTHLPEWVRAKTLTTRRGLAIDMPRASGL